MLNMSTDLMFFFLQHQMLALSIALISPFIWLFILTKEHGLPKLIAVLLFVVVGLVNASATISWIIAPAMSGCKKALLLNLLLRLAPVFIVMAVGIYLVFQYDQKKKIR